MKLTKLIFLGLFFLTSLFAMTKDEIKPHMTNKINTILSILEKTSLNTKQKGIEIVKIIDEVFDYTLMSRISLGKRVWLNMSKEQKKSFIKEFELRLKNSYIDKLDLYSNQKIKILDLIAYKKTRLQLQSELVGQNENYAINYNFYDKRKTNNWLIYDVDLAGVSIIQTYRKQFAGHLKEKSINELIQMLKKQNSK